jgi:TM2 domain-containing membrane protein YozV
MAEPRIWFYSVNGQESGPVSARELKGLAAEHRLRPTDLVWKDGMSEWKPAAKVGGLFATGEPPPLPKATALATVVTPLVATSEATSPHYREFVNKRDPAGVCGLLLGGLAIHKFMLGQTTPAVILLVVNLLSFVGGFFTCGVLWIFTVGVGVISLIEGITYLTKSDEEFYRRYAIEKREWF